VANRKIEAGAATAALIGLARSLYRRWERLGPDDRERLGALAHDVREGALELRGRLDRTVAERELAREVESLRLALAAELDRMSRRDAA
jgi:hypothetical protein